MFLSPQGAPAATCFPPPRSLRRCLAAASTSISRPTTGRENTAPIFPPALITIPSATTTDAGLVSKALATFTLARGLAVSVGLIRRLKPGVVVGFGGYPTAPPMVAAALLGVPSVLHEQNAVIGRANKFLAPRATLDCDGLSRSQRRR